MCIRDSCRTAVHFLLPLFQKIYNQLFHKRLRAGVLPLLPTTPVSYTHLDVYKGQHIPYTAQMIATLTRHQIGTVERALETFRQLGLVEQLDSGAFYMTDIEPVSYTHLDVYKRQ